MSIDAEDLLKKACENAANTRVSLIGKHVENALNAFWGKGKWTPEDVKQRCFLAKNTISEEEIFYADGVPLLIIYPHRIETLETGRIKVTQEIKSWKTSSKDY